MAYEHTTPFSIAWLGINQIALATPDLEATLHFYSYILGMQTSEILPSNSYHGRHAFIRMGTQEALGLHFFEYSDARIFTPPGQEVKLTFIPGGMQHITFILPGEGEALSLRTRLIEHKVITSDIKNQGVYRHIVFYDNIGIRLEAIWNKEEMS